MAAPEASRKPKRMTKSNRKKYSLNVEDGKLVSVEVDGVEYKDPEDIPNEEDRDTVEMLIMGGPDFEPEDLGQPSTAVLALPKIILWIFGGVTALMLVITIIATINTSRAMAREVAVPARVVELIPVNSTEGSTLYAPIVDFVGADNERHIVQASGASWPPAYRVGQPITVRYDPADLETARIASTGNNLEQYTVALITGVLALAFAGASVFAWWMGKQ